MSTKQDWIIGFHAVGEVLEHQPGDVDQLSLQSSRSDERINALRAIAAQHSVPIEELDKREMDKRFPGNNQGVAVLLRNPIQAKTEKQLTELLDNLDHDPLLLVLDGLTDPHNLGACLRTADAAGVDAVIIPKDKSAPLNATVHKVASGAAQAMNIIAVTNLSRCLESLQKRGIWTVGTADETAKSVYEQELTGPLALIMGSEGSGLRRLTRDHCDFLISIPMKGKVSSLNVSVATGVCLYEALRQRST